MHLTAELETRFDAPPRAAPEPLVRDPVNQSPLWRRGDLLVSEDGERSYRRSDLPHLTYDLFAPSPARRTPLRSAAPWDPARFDAHYEEVGYYEDGAEYERRVGAAERLTRFHHSRVKDILERWVAPDPGHMVMDVGCGAGWFLERIWRRYRDAGHSPLCVGLEASRRQAEFTAERMSRVGMDSGAVVIGNAERLPFADDTFHLVTCSETLEQVETPRRAIAEMARVLRPGGKLLLSAPSRLAEQTWDVAIGPAVKAVKTLLRRPPSQPFGEFYAALYPEEMHEAVEEAGLVVHCFVQNGVIPHNHYFLQLPKPLVPPLVAAFDWIDRRYGHHVPSLAAHVLLWAEKPAR